MYIRVADEVWIATTRLHYYGPDQSEFEVGEIIRSAERTVGGGRFGRACLLTPIFIALRTRRQAPPGGTGCWFGRRRGGGACSVRGTPSTPAAMGGRAFRRASGSPTATVI